MYAGHVDLSVPLLQTIDRVLTPARCREYVRLYQQLEPEQAKVTTNQGEGVDLSRRNNSRVMWDDAVEADILARAAHLAARRASVWFPSRFRGRRLVGANPRLRIYRYGEDQQHTFHRDSEVSFAEQGSSTMTLIIYLNDGFDGGTTEFPEIHEVVSPQVGRAAIFQHAVLHRAAPVTRGEKFVLRTDLIFEPIRERAGSSPCAGAPTGPGHQNERRKP